MKAFDTYEMPEITSVTTEKSESEAAVFVKTNTCVILQTSGLWLFFLAYCGSFLEELREAETFLFLSCGPHCPGVGM